MSVEATLNQLPQFSPAQSQYVGDQQPSAVNTVGIATANLRGLGANRTLVLLDGRRPQPANAALVVDLNTIPTAAINGVEIITGGASAVYGADAVAGVVNFKLRNNFQGMELDAQYGITGKPGTAPGELNTPDGFDLLLPDGSTPTHPVTG